MHSICIHIALQFYLVSLISIPLKKMKERERFLYCSSPLHGLVQPCLRQSRHCSLPLLPSGSGTLYWNSRRENHSSPFLLPWDFYSGPNSTALTVVNPRNDSSFSFGAMAAIDDMIKEGPDPSSKLIGTRIRIIYYLFKISFLYQKCAQKLQLPGLTVRTFFFLK